MNRNEGGNIVVPCLYVISSKRQEGMTTQLKIAQLPKSKALLKL